MQRREIKFLFYFCSEVKHWEPTSGKMFFLFKVALSGFVSIFILLIAIENLGSKVNQKKKTGLQAAY